MIKLNPPPAMKLDPIETGSHGEKARPHQQARVVPFRRFSSVSIVFPAFNEENNIEHTIAEARNVFSRYFRQVEILVVDDGSSDRTAELIDALSSRSDDVVAIHHPTNRGYGAALRSGFDKAQNDFIFFTDSDLQFDLEEIEKLLPWLDSHEIVMGYRERRADSSMRCLNAWAWNILVHIVLGLKVKDLDCAFKIFRSDQLESVDLSSIGAMINTEFLYLAKRRGARFKEVPVSHYPRKHGKQTGANLSVILKAFRELWHMYRKVNGSVGSSALHPTHRRQGSSKGVEACVTGTR